MRLWIPANPLAHKSMGPLQAMLWLVTHHVCSSLDRTVQDIFGASEPGLLLVLCSLCSLLTVSRVVWAGDSKCVHSSIC